MTPIHDLKDDPNSKIGKAYDDSLLFRKPASRLGLSNRNELMDIAKFDSSRNSSRPTLKTWGTGSYASIDNGEDGSHGGSVRREARRRQHNFFFHFFSTLWVMTDLIYMK